MPSSWTHYWEIKSKCPICGACTHAARSAATGRICWLHDRPPRIDDYLHTHKGHIFVDVSTADLLLAADKAIKAASRRPSPTASTSTRPVTCRETGMTYASIREAADTVGISRSCITNAIKRGGTAADYHWLFAPSPRPDRKE